MNRLKWAAAWAVVFLFGNAKAAPAPDGYDELWKQVRNYEQKDLPKSAAKVVEQIAAKAAREQKTGQQVAARLYGCVLRQQVVPDSFYNDVLMLERCRRETADEVLRAVYASVLGEIYQGRSRGTSNGSKTQAHPDSLREWSSSQYKEAATECYRQSLARPELLAGAHAADFVPFVERGKNAGYFNGDLLNVIGRRAVESGTWDKEQVRHGYATMLNAYRTRGNREAELLLMLDSIGQEPQPEDVRGTQDQYVLQSDACRAYRRMLDRFGDLPLAAEIYIRMVQLPVSAGQKVAWIDEGYARYSGYARAKELLNVKLSLESACLSLNGQDVVYPGITYDWKVLHRHLSGATLEWLKMPAGITRDSLQGLSDKKLRELALRHGKAVKTQRLEWAESEPWRGVTDTLKVETPELGLYVLFLVPDGSDKRSEKTTLHTVSVSRLRTISCGMPGQRTRCIVVDGKTGMPVAGATIKYMKAGKLKETYITDANGAALMPEPDQNSWGNLTNRNDRVQWIVSKGEDRHLPPTNATGSYYYRNDTTTHVTDRLYTDRAIYRPGQTVYMGGLHTLYGADYERVLPDQKVEVTLRDANGREVDKRTLSTDDMGKFSTEFILPSTGLQGRYTLRTAHGTAYFLVESYKRPTFEVKLNPVQTVYHPGDTVALTGEVMGFNGVAVRGARITAQSVMHNYWYRSRPDDNGPVALDTVYTDETGRFTLRVPISQTDALAKGIIGPRQSITVEAMNRAGESHEAEISLPLGREGLNINAEVSKYWERDALPEVRVRLTTASGNELKDSVTLTYTLARVGKDGQKTVMQAARPLPHDKAVTLDECAGWTSGCYELTLHAVTATDTAETVCPFRLFGWDDVRPAEGADKWFYADRSEADAEHPVRISVGSGREDVTLYYILYGKDRVIRDTVYHLTDSLLTFTYPAETVTADGLTAVFFYMKDEQTHFHTHTMTMRRPDRELRMQWTSFRDRLQPGTKETWRLRVTTPDGKPAPAQLMATLYDASLDQLRTNNWSLYSYFSSRVPQVIFGNYSVYSNMWMSYYESPKNYSVKEPAFDRFDSRYTTWGLFAVPELFECVATSAALGSSQSTMRIRGTKEAAMKMTKIRNDVAEVEEAIAEDSASAEALEANGADAGGSTLEQTGVQIRENLNETAFFYPNLHADRTGEVTIGFTLPESLTTWKFMALAHTQDMMTGLFTDKIVAAKEVMAQLQLPRFVRLGDKATFSATLQNLTDKAVKGTVTVEIFDPATEKVLMKDKRKLKLAAKADSVMTFRYEPQEGVTLPACRVTFEAGDYSDGEQRYLPVLEDKEWLTQTEAIEITRPGETVIPLDGLFQNNHKDADHRQLTLEYAANPIWYAVQALPSVLEPRDKDVLSLAAAVYASELSGRLAAQYPQLKTVTGAWKRQAGDKLQGQLSEQEDLTGLLLSETPWVADADAEDRRVQSLQQLFDANRATDLQRDFCEKLGKLQQADGSFAWFNGMRGSSYLTLGVARLLARAGMMDGTDIPSALKTNVNRKQMMTYLAGAFHKAVERDKELRSEGKPGILEGALWLDYYYTTQLCDASWLDAQARADIAYGLKRMSEKRFELDLSDKAAASVVLHRAGHKAEAADLTRSLREHLVSDKDGLHLEYPSGGYVTSNRKISTHVLIMEALKATGAATTDENAALCRWLLLQKRVQNWPTSVGTMDAVYALLTTQDGDLAPQAGDEITWTPAKGETAVRMNSGEGALSGLGYVTARVDGSDVRQGGGTLTVQKNGKNATAWGAAYAQFRLPMSEVEAHSEGMRVRCELSQSDLRVGNRLTLRYIITSDKDYEYVRLKTGRAACMEPVQALSGYGYNNGLGYYKEVGDAATTYFFERLPKGTFVLEEEVYVERAGSYSLGVPKLSGVYAPEFGAYGTSQTLEVKP